MEELFESLTAEKREKLDSSGVVKKTLRKDGSVNVSGPRLASTWIQSGMRNFGAVLYFP